jgi:hypothetical protein
MRTAQYILTLVPEMLQPTNYIEEAKYFNLLNLNGLTAIIENEHEREMLTQQ